MLAYNDNHNSLPPSDKSITQDQFFINSSTKDLNSYVTFLYNEAKRLSSRPVTLKEIQEFIQTPEGQRGFKAYLSMSKPSKQVAKPKAVGSVLGEIL